MSEDQMIKRVFVFSDMEFDEACGRYNYCDYDYDMEEIDESQKASQKRKFREKGYRKVPEIVFWNLRNSSATPVMATENGVALVSGFSKNLLDLVFGRRWNSDPSGCDGISHSGEDYKKLVLFD